MLKMALVYFAFKSTFPVLYSMDVNFTSIANESMHQAPHHLHIIIRLLHSRTLEPSENSHYWLIHELSCLQRKEKILSCIFQLIVYRKSGRWTKTEKNNIECCVKRDSIIERVVQFMQSAARRPLLCIPDIYNIITVKNLAPDFNRTLFVNNFSFSPMCDLAE